MRQGKFAMVWIIMTVLLCLSPLGAAAATATTALTSTATVTATAVTTATSTATVTATAATNATVTTAKTTTAKTVNVTTQSVTLIFDGRELKLPDKQYSFVYDQRVYVPVRYISYALLKNVGWDGKQVTVTEPSDEGREKLRKHLEQASEGTTKPQASVKLSVTPLQAKLVFDGKEKKLPAGQEVFNYNGSLYVPIRFLAESVGTEIGWDAKSKTVSGESAAYQAEQGIGGVKPGTGDGEGEEAGAGTDGSPGAGTVTPPATGGGGAVPGAGGGGSVKPTYEQITGETETKLTNLKQACFLTLSSTYLDYKDATNEAEKERLKAKGQSELDSCTANFEAIMSDTTAKLTTNGYSTDIVAEYRKQFEKTLSDAKKALG
jgi:hypothetical protein